jgi:hypothetical protein
MTYTLIYMDYYLKRAEKFVKRNPDQVFQYEKPLEILEINSSHLSLRYHALKEKLKGLHSVSNNISYRTTLEFLITGKQILLVNVGHHDVVY